jgi:hypothetical protein
LLRSVSSSISPQFTRQNVSSTNCINTTRLWHHTRMQNLNCVRMLCRNLLNLCKVASRFAWTKCCEIPIPFGLLYVLSVTYVSVMMDNARSMFSYEGQFDYALPLLWIITCLDQSSI